MKNIIICGVSRSGKTTLVEMLSKKLNYNVFETDILVSAFQDVFPELGISHKDEFKTSKLFSPFMFKILEEFLDDDKNYIVDSYHLFPNELRKYHNNNKFEIIFLGYPKLTEQEIFKNIRKYDVGDEWTAKITDDELMGNCKLFKKISQLMMDDCKKYNFRFVDVSYNREKILKTIAKEITRRVKDEI